MNSARGGFRTQIQVHLGQLSVMKVEKTMDHRQLVGNTLYYNSPDEPVVAQR